MDTFARGVAMLSRVCGVVAGALMVVSVVVITEMVVLRYGFGQPTIWQTEFVIYALVATTLLGSPYVLLHRGHVNMDIVVLAASPRVRFWLAVIADVLSLGFCLTLTIYGATFWHEAWARDWHSDSLWRVPLWIPYLSLPVGFGVLTLQLVVQFVGLLTGRTAPFGQPQRVAAGEPNTGARR